MKRHPDDADLVTCLCLARSETVRRPRLYCKTRDATISSNRINNIKTASYTDCQGLSLKGSAHTNTVDGRV